MAGTIKFGTDGWRAIIAQEYTVENVQRIADATGRWMLTQNMTKVVIGHDCRFGGSLFSETTARVIGSLGIHVFLDREYVSTPMVSLGVVKLNADLGVVITASHNPPSYNGYKLKSIVGGPSIPADIDGVEALILDNPPSDILTLDEIYDKGLLTFSDLEQIYFDHASANFDLPLIHKSGIKMAYDAMYGAGQRIVERLLPDTVRIHCEYNPTFYGQAPEPIHRNLTELSELVKYDDTILCGLANDGDADRIGMYDENGDFVDSHRLLLLLLMYMVEHKKMTGLVVGTFSVTEKLEKLAKHYNLPYQTAPIGFKYIAEIAMKEDIVVGGEESGGLSVKGHIPERDGVWNGLLLLEFMTKTGKTLTELLEDVYAIVGRFDYSRDDLHIDEMTKQAIIKKCSDQPFESFGKYKVTKLETLDGFKFHFDDTQWVMIRPSGTEPVLRVYAQGKDMDEVKDILQSVHATLKTV